MPTSRKQRKETQRERVIAGMLDAVVRKGYANANVAHAIANAKVSRPTFYEYFTDKEDCFLAVHSEISERLIGRVQNTLQAHEPERAVQVAVRTLIERAEANPSHARLLVNETLAGGRRALDQRDATIARLAQIIDDTRANASPDASTPDLPLNALIGGICGLLAPGLRRNEHDFRHISQEVESWIDGYCHPSSEHRWRTLAPGPKLPPPEHVSQLVLGRPAPLAPGRPSVSSAEVARNQRQRILYATAEVAVRKGYNAATVADIVSAAGVERRVFYENFRDKQQAFLAVHELGFQQMMAVCASAFFSASSWPERIWRALHAGTHFDATYPILSHIGYVESHAVGSPAIQRVEDSHAAFKIFLQEGLMQAERCVTRITADAVAKTAFELGYLQARVRRIDLLPRLTPHATYLILTPFLGRAATNEFIDEKLRSRRSARARTGSRR